MNSKHISGTPLTPDEIKEVKGIGCLRDKRYNDIFNVRVITGNGKLTSEKHRAVAQAADKFGSGEVAMTTRLTLEIQGVEYNNLEKLFAFLSENGLESGGTGPKVRPVVSCKGTTCIFGLIDTYSLSLKIHEKFYKGYHSTPLPHKFKIAVGGCPNNCVKPELNDLGVIGQRVPIINVEKCKGCKKCSASAGCPMKAFNAENGKVSINTDICNNCGRCIPACPFDAISHNGEAYRVFIGGRWGKKTAKAQPLSRIFATEDEVLEVVERAIIFFRDNGISGERFSDTIERIGFKNVEKELLK
ncbi:MAG: 4Fe-4S dicluster domain-containing protein [Clostridia bacterium]|nr:4Fe-4S dicluster domain-containing protein [Clostridia bacterium]